MAAAAGFGRLLKEIARPSLTSGALTSGLALVGGANPLQALATGATDVVASALPLGILRKVSPGSYKKRTVIDKATGKESVVQDVHPLETPLNVAASVGAGYITNPIIYGTGQPQQIAQQIEQRSVVNQLPLYKQIGELAPGTQLQTTGLPPGDEFQRLLNQRGDWTQYLTPQDQQLIQQTLGA